MQHQRKWLLGGFVLLGLALAFLHPHFIPRDRMEPVVASHATGPDTIQPSAALSDPVAAALLAGSAVPERSDREADLPATEVTYEAGTIFDTFNDWADRYVQATGQIDWTVLEDRGIELARSRRMALAELIRVDPETALAHAVPTGVRTRLPQGIIDLLEEHVNGHGDLDVLAALPEPGRESEVDPVWRIATIDGREYQAYVYGRRLGEPTRRNIPLSGVAVEDLLAVRDSPIRMLSPDEVAPWLATVSEADCSVCEEPADARGQPVIAAVGAGLRVLCCPEHAAELEDDLTAAESGGPTGDFDADDVQASAWTEGLKSVILIRVDFSDLTGVSLTESGGATLINNLHNFYNEMSYGRAGFRPVDGGSAVTPILRMPETAAYYGGNNRYGQLRSDARAAATAAGYVLSQYNLDVTCMGPVPGFGWSGLAYVGAAGMWLRNSFGTGVAGHELGHNFGLHHAGFWDTGGASIIGPGTHLEYGDGFDTMGSASAGNNHFNARYKSYLNWLQPGETQTASTSGLYRIYAHDQPLTPGSRGLRIARNSTTNYWVEFRQKFTGNRWLMNGAGLRFAGNGNQRSVLLDTTPGSAQGRTDSALVIGRTFADPEAGIYITPLGKSGTTPESLEVMVHLGGFPGNLPPAVILSASETSTAINVPLEFAAHASDPNGDALAYYWDFGDSTLGPNSPDATKSWTSQGDYVVRCTVTDMKGGETSQSVVVRVGSPSTFRIHGLVTDSNGPVQGARIYVSNSKLTYTDSDGSYSLVGLSSGSYTVNASLYPHTFVPVGFSNPVRVGPDAFDINFSSSTVLPPTITAQPQSQSVDLGASVTFAVAATGTQPISYQWRFNGVNITGATASSYTPSNVQATDAGNYSVLVTNPGGSVASAIATLTVNAPPVIVGHPQGQDVLAGVHVTFQVTATGTAPLSYQWYHQGTIIPGATGSTHTRSNVQLSDAGDYTVVVSNEQGSTTSAAARLTVNFGLVVQAMPGGTVTVEPSQPWYAPGTPVTLTAESQSVYQFDGWTGDANGADNPLTLVVTQNLNVTARFLSPVPDLIVDNPSATFTGNWSTDTAAANKYGSNYRTVGSAANSPSATATFTPLIETPGRYDLFVWHPTVGKAAPRVPFQIVHANSTQTVSVNQTTGAGEWRLIASGVPFASGTSGFVRIANNVGQGGRTVAADAVKWVYSPVQEATPPLLLSQPASVTVQEGADVEFSVEAGGTAPLSYLWRWNGMDILDATEPTLLLTNVQPADAGAYIVTVFNELGEVTSAPATLTVLGPPLIVSEPQNQAIGAGSNAVMQVISSGAAPLHYQWRKDDIDLADDERVQGTGSPTLVIQSAIPSDAGAYSVHVQNPLGSVTSSLAFLRVGFEADLGPDPHGDNQVNHADLERLARVIAGLEELTDHWQFARADCAPRDTFGDGLLSLTDWVQAGRYADALDPLTPAGGPTTAVTPTGRGVSSASGDATDPPVTPSRIRVVGGPLVRGQETQLTLELVSQSEENAVAFTLEFDPDAIEYRDLATAGELEACTLVLNTSQLADGRVGVMFGLLPGDAFPAGTNALLHLTFVARAETAAMSTELHFGDEPVYRDVATVRADTLPFEFESASLPLATQAVIVFRSVRMTSPDEVRLTVEGTPGDCYVIERSTDLAGWEPMGTLTNLTGTVGFVDPAPPVAGQRFYRGRLVADELAGMGAE
jgi:uncharacterized repeat protein (TIGR02543 family)